MSIRFLDRLRRHHATHRYHAAFAGVFVVFVFRLLLAITVIPPWQNPDEPQHFAFVRLLASQQTLDLSSRRDLTIERDILHSMAEHGWWTHYGEATPEPTPATFSAVPAHLNVVLDFAPVYYVLAASCVRALGLVALLDQYYALRWLGVLLALPTLWCVWAGARLLFGDRVALGASMLVALHPQFGLVSIAVSPGLLVNLLAGIVWWQGARILTGRTPIASALVVMTVSTAAVFTKRSAAPLVAITGVMLMYVVSDVTRGQVKRVLLLFATAMATLVLVGGAITLFPKEAGRVAGSWSYFLTSARLERVLDLAYLRNFLTALFDSSWLFGGWQRYPAPLLWRLAVYILVLFAVLGLVLRRAGPTNAALKPGILFATLFVLIQLAGIGLGPYLSRFGGQGRYLLPAIGPWMSLLWIGIHRWWPFRLWPFVSVGLVGLMLLLDVIGWAAVLIPTYVP